MPHDGLSRSLSLPIWKSFVNRCWVKDPGRMDRLFKRSAKAIQKDFDALIKSDSPRSRSMGLARLVFGQDGPAITIEYPEPPHPASLPDQTGLRNGKKSVLFYVENVLTVNALKKVAELLRGDPRLACYFTMPSRQDKDRRTIAQAVLNSAGLRCEFVHCEFARLKRWDLVLCAEHIAGYDFHPSVPQVRFNHGFCASKNYESSGETWLYGHMPRRPDGVPVYARLFEVNKALYARALKRDPRLKGRLVLAGDLRADRLRSLVPDRQRIRRRLGFGPADTVVLFMSTCDDRSLLETMGRKLIDEAAQLMNTSGHRFILASHPILWDSGVWPEYLSKQEGRGFTVVRPYEDWEPYLVAADVALADHTSLANYFPLLRRPLIYTPVRDQFVPGSVSWRLYQYSLKLTQPSSLAERIRKAVEQGQDPRLSSVVSGLCAHPGQAAARIGRELYGLLGLRPRRERS